MTKENVVDYSSEVALLLEGIQSGRLQIEKLTKKQNRRSMNKQTITMVIVDTSLPDRKGKKILPKKINTTTTEKVKKEVSTPIAPPRPPMCQVVKV